LSEIERSFTMPEIWDVLDSNANLVGRTCVRGPMRAGEYHLVVGVWVLRSDGQFILSKRSPNKPMGNMWEATGGSAIAGDDSLTTAIKEVHEELGITLLPENGQFFKRYRRDFAQTYDGGWAQVANGDGSHGGDFVDIWLFRQDFELSDITLCPEETCDAMLADCVTIRRMLNDGIMVDFMAEHYDNFFAWCGLE